MISTAGPVVVTHELTKRYGEFTALDNLSFMLDRGQILGFIDDQGVVSPQAGIRMYFRQQNTIGHKLHPGRR